MVPGFESALFSLFLWLHLLCASLTAASQEMFVQIMEIQYKCNRFELRTVPRFVLFNPDLGFTHFGFVLTCKSAQKSLQVVLRCWPLSRFSSSCWNLFDFPAPQSSGSELAPAQFFVASFAYLGTEAMPGSFLFPVNLPFNFIRVPRPVILSWCVLFLVGKVFLLPVPAVTLHCVLG